MTIAQSLIGFSAAAVILAITPGVDTAMVLRAAAGGIVRRAAFAAAGIGLGCLAWGAAVSLGLGALLAASATAFTIVKWMGAAYLLWLGIHLILKPRDRLTMIEADTADRGSGGALARGFLSNLLNPKVGVFYITFLPQFVPPGVNVAAFSFLLACVHVLLGALWFALLIAATVPLGKFLARPAIVKALDRITGGVFVAFGVRLALARPH